MRYIAIVLFIFAIQVSAAVVNSTGIFITTVQPMNDWFTTVDQTQLSDANYVQGQVNSNSISFGFGDFVKGLFYFVVSLGLGIIAVPYTLASFGMHSPYIYFFSLPIYLLYFIAIAQFISNRSSKGMT